MKIVVYPLLIIACCMYSAVTAQTVNLNPVDDNTLYEDLTGQLSNGAGQGLFTGVNGPSGGNGIRRAVLKFNIAGNIPAGATITNVSLQLTVTQTGAGPTNVNIHTLSADWGEGTSIAGGGGGGGGTAQTSDATWIHTFYNTQFWTNPGGDFNPISSAVTSVAGVGNYTWSSAQMITEVQNWLDNPSTDFGWIVIGNESTGSTAKRFASKEYFSSTSRPTLTVAYTVPCIDPVITAFNATATSICAGTNVQLSVTGTLNGATAWQLYAGSCGSTPLATNATGIFNVAPTLTTDYFVRGIGGCVTPGTCSTLTITVLPPDDPSFSYASMSYCNNDANASPTITGTPGGNFTSLPGGLSINASTGEIDFNTSSAGAYNITYTTNGPNCTASQNFTVTVHPIFTTSTSATICNGDTYVFGSQTLDTAGTYNELFTSEFGCDSTVTLTLAVTMVDTAVSDTGFTLHALGAGTYQWLDCDMGFAPITGETAAQFSPAANGNYAVEVTQNGCTDTSSCHFINGIGIMESNGLIDGLTIYPNPANDFVQVKLTNGIIKQLDVFSITGALINSYHPSLDACTVHTKNLWSGLYLLKITTSLGTITRPVVIE